uniref:ubiquitinyl hydrolase 1 n=1 Tax=Clastoptera arizonana TaxID=38151 RepID=A0A1B6DR09_9HEMI
MDCKEIISSKTSSHVEFDLEFSDQASPKNNDSFGLSENDNDLSVDNLPAIGIENNWDEEENYAMPSSHDFQIPLPPPSGYDDFSPCVTQPHSSNFDGDIISLFSPTEVHESGVGDLFDIRAEAGVCGLRNLGNTCFMSTGVQCLMATPALVKYFLEQNDLMNDSLIAHLSSLTQKMWSGQYSSIQPTDFKDILGEHFPQFKDFRQHDCQEFLALLLDGLHEQMNSAASPAQVYSRNKQNKKVDLNTGPKDFIPVGEECSSSNNIFSKHINGVTKNKNAELNDIGLNLGDEILDKNITCESHLNKSMDNNSLCGNNLILLNSKVKINSFGDKEKQVEGFLNNSTQVITGLEDITKDSKTSNVNVLVTEQEANNEIRFDSEKFPRNDIVRRRESLNLNAFQIYENNTSSMKRGKSTVIHYSCAADFREGLDLKRLKLNPREDHVEEIGVEGDEMEIVVQCDQEKNQRMEEERKHRQTDDSSVLEKNFRMECERKRREMADISELNAGPSSACTKEKEEICLESQLKIEPEAETHWEKHLAAHQSVIVDTFQGQFRSTVVCSSCKYVSVTYEPFMYLSVPLPHAMEQQLCITLVETGKAVPMQFMLTVNKRGKVTCLKKQLLQFIEKSSPLLVFAEGLDHHVSKILDDNCPLRFVNTVSRSLYAFEITNFHSSESDSSLAEGTESQSNNSVNNSSNDGEACTICLEEMDSNMSHHIGCACILCDSCITRSTQHYGGGVLICPVCHKKLSPGIDFVAIEYTKNINTAIRMFYIPVVFRLDTLGDGNNNTKLIKLFGHPRLLRLPNHIQGEELHEIVNSVVPYSLPYKLVFVDGQGHHCSRCMYHLHCRGCLVPTNGPLVLHTNDTLAVMFSDPVDDVILKHSSMQSKRDQHPLSLYDCIHAFSQSEILDEHNPWYCPKCQQNQCATKTLSIWRYPRCLIVYLKRFVFQDCISTKIEDKVMFPLCGLIMDSRNSLYDLYACVCHVGGVSAGHYTAYTQHPHTGEWHHFNDDCVTKQMPLEDDYSNAYILFYKMRERLTHLLITVS